MNNRNKYRANREANERKLREEIKNKYSRKKFFASLMVKPILQLEFTSNDQVYDVKLINHVDDLLREGQEMQHYVGVAYLNLCKRKERLIFSIINRNDPKDRATASICSKGASSGRGHNRPVRIPTVDQIQGFRNHKSFKFQTQDFKEMMSEHIPFITDLICVNRDKPFELVSRFERIIAILREKHDVDLAKRIEYYTGCFRRIDELTMEAHGLDIRPGRLRGELEHPQLET